MITPIQHTGKYKNFITKWKTLRRIRNVLTGFHVSNALYMYYMME